MSNVGINFGMRYPLTKAHPERKHNESPILVVVRWQNKKFKANVGEKILPGNWDTKKQRAKVNYIGVKDKSERRRLEERAEEINDLLYNVIKPRVESIFSTYRNAGNPLPTLQQFSLDYKGRGAVSSMNLIDFIENEIPRKRFTVKTTNQERSITPGTLRSYKQTKNLLEAFTKESRRKPLDFDDIDQAFYEQFRTWMESRKVRARKDNSNTIGGRYAYGHTANFIGKMVNNIKAIMNYAVQQGLTKNMAYKGFKTPKDTGIQHTYLTVEELRQMQALTFIESECNNLEVARDIFLVGAWTGLRSSDLEAFNDNATINHDGTISVRTQKTGNWVEIPLMPVVQSILDKYNGQLPRMVNQLVNRYIKRVAQRLDGFDQEMKLERTEGGFEVRRSMHRYEMVSSHSARRSFATNMYVHYGVDAFTIMQITGHKTIRVFENYIKITKKQAAQRLAQKIASIDAAG